MLRFPIAKFLPAGTKSAAGTVIGEDHRQEILTLLSSVDLMTPTIFLLDYEDVEHATSSYVKRTTLWLFRCGGAFCGSMGGMGADELLGDLGGIVPVPTNVFPVVANLSEDVRSEIDEVFARRVLPILEALEFNRDGIPSARVLGQPELSVHDTLAAIAGLGSQEVTAKTLFGAMSKAGIGLTAWGNRLADLHRLRILDRRKQGKEWVYRPVASTFEYGRKTTSKRVKNFTERTDAAQDALLRTADLINRVVMNQERLIHFDFSEPPEVGEYVRFIDDGHALVSVFAGVNRIGQASAEDSKFLRAEIFDPENTFVLARVVEVDACFQSAAATLQNPL